MPNNKKWLCHCCGDNSAFRLTTEEIKYIKSEDVCKECGSLRFYLHDQCKKANKCDFICDGQDTAYCECEHHHGVCLSDESEKNN